MRAAAVAAKGEVGDREASRLLYSCWNLAYIWYFNFVV